MWNLLPSSHAAAWDDEEAYERMFQIKFYKEEDGVVKPVSHGVKELRGELVHHIVIELPETIEDLEEWEAPGGYEVDLEASELDESGGGVIAMVSRPGWEERRAARRKVRQQEEAEIAAAKRAREADDED